MLSMHIIWQIHELIPNYLFTLAQFCLCNVFIVFFNTKKGIKFVFEFWKSILNTVLCSFLLSGANWDW